MTTEQPRVGADPSPTGPGLANPNPGTPHPAVSEKAIGTADPPPPTDAPPTDAGPTDAPPTDAPPTAPATDAPPTGRPGRKALPTTRPPGAPPDPWTAFATTRDRTPGRLRRGLRAVGRSVIHEYALVIYSSLLLAVALTWPTLRYPLHTVPQDTGDPARQAWQIAWSGHILLTNPARLWQSNAFYPERYSFAFGDSLLGYAPAGLLGEGPLAAILRYNVLFVLAHALLAIGGYALVRQLGAGRTGAVVAAAAIAYAPWRLAQEGHLDIISAGGIPLALAMLARGHGWSLRHGFRPNRRHAGWAALGWLVAAWQISLGFSLGLPFAYVLAFLVLLVAIAVPVRRLRARRKRRAANRALQLTGDLPSPGAGDVQRPSAGKEPLTAAEQPGPEASLTAAAEATQTTVLAAKGAATTEVAAAITAEPARTGLDATKVVTALDSTGPEQVGKNEKAARKGRAWRREKAARKGKVAKADNGRAVLGGRLLVTDLLGILITVGIGTLIALPYFRVPATGPGSTEISFFSPPLRGLLIGPAQSRIWGAPHAGPRSSLGWAAEMALLPGFVLYALALVGLVFSIWTLRQRLFLLLALAAGVILTLGTTFFDGRWTYLPLFGHLPGSFGLRIPGRLMLWVTLLLAIFAAGAVAEIVRRAEHMSAQRMPPWPGPWLRLATFVPLLLVLVEGWNATPHPVLPAQPAAMRTVTGPMLVLPTTSVGDQTVLLWSTTRFQPVANGGGAFASVRQAELRRTVAAFPDPASIQYLRSLGVSTVLVLRAQVAGTPWERAGDIPVDALGIQREDLDDAVLFRLN